MLLPEDPLDLVRDSAEGIAGAYAGMPVATGVSTDELSAWPAIPPHWVHLPASINFVRSNTQASPIPGWLKHARHLRALALAGRDGPMRGEGGWSPVSLGRAETPARFEPGVFAPGTTRPPPVDRPCPPYRVSNSR